ncbi:MAG: hypothetical protein ABFE07_16265 [Armatimonadia bacterium]
MLILSLLIDTICRDYYADIIVTRWHRTDTSYAVGAVAYLDATRGTVTP